MVVPQAITGSIRTSILNDFKSAITHGAVGSGTTTPTENDTTLETETYREVLFDKSTTTNSIVTEFFLDTADNNGNVINEYGLFDAASGGNMYIRSITNMINKTSSFEVFVEGIIKINIIST
jgi:hypothetical protein